MARYHVSLQKSTIVCVVSPNGLRGEASNVKQKISGFSNTSGVRMRRYLRGCAAEYTHLYTLTYPECFPIDGRLCKRHLKLLFQRMDRLWNGDLRNSARQGAGTSMFWFLEFQERGAPHFHIFATRPIDYKWIRSAWYEICGTDDIRHLYAGCRVEKLRTGRGGTISYAGKYAAKQSQKAVPLNFLNVGRFWGISGCRRLVSAAISVLVQPKNTEELKKTFDSCEKRCEIMEKRGHLKRVRTQRAGAFSFYSLDDVGQSFLCQQMKGFVELFCLCGMDFTDQLYQDRDILSEDYRE